ncbi:hypothetical protein [Burkholderia gladioli]|jgi:hypothetical protein|uniref:hypothetical protein n=1 Tax=Burkholderia gladioli TaxID=28095 RepID=UPI00163F6AB2|nr:hypothetical protein [Burkholderia gladioli]
MDDEKQEWPAVQIATLTQQMRSAASSVEDIKRSVQPFAHLGRGFAEMRVRAESVREDVGLQWTRSHAEGSMADTVVSRRSSRPAPF